MTRAEWNASTRRTGEDVGRTQRNASGGVSCNRDPMGGC